MNAINSQITLSIDHRELFSNGMVFGNIGPYEKVLGKIHFFIDSKARINQCVIDLDHAPVNSSGLVEYSTNFYILKPDILCLIIILVHRNP